jgi:hypothetical protein
MNNMMGNKTPTFSADHREFSFEPDELESINKLLDNYEASPFKSCMRFTVSHHYEFREGKRELDLVTINLHHGIVSYMIMVTFHPPSMSNFRVVSKDDAVKFWTNMDNVVKTYHRFLDIFENAVEARAEVATDDIFHYLTQDDIELFHRYVSVQSTGWDVIEAMNTYTSRLSSLWNDVEKLNFDNTPLIPPHA